MDRPAPEDSTARLALYRPQESDLPDVYAICSDPRLWTHYPSRRHIESARTARSLQLWTEDWARAGFGTWIAREPTGSAVIGYGGCTASADGEVWNLGYRLAVAAQGRGLATELGRRALERAAALEPARPIVAYLLEHNVASARVVDRLGLGLVARGPDAGNPDSDAIRLVYADRPLTDAQRAVAFCR